MNPLNSKPTQQQAQAQPQNPREQALNLMKQLNIDVPKGKENDPDFLINYVMQTGKVPQAQNRLTMAQQMMQRMFRR